MTLSRRNLIGLAIAGSLLSSTALTAAEPIKIGTIATLEGAFTVLGQEGMRGVDMALKKWGNKAGGKDLVIIRTSSDTSPDSAIRAVKKLVEQDGVDIVVGPLSGSEGLAIKDYAKTQPNVTFINGTSAAQDTTLRDPAPNFYRFTGDGAQWMAGLGDYVYNTKGYRKIVTIGEDYSFPYTMTLGFLNDFCKLGGKVSERFWVPIGNKDYSTIVASIPDDVDAIYVALGGADAVNFLSQYEQGGGDKPLIGGTITVDQSVLGSKGRRKSYIVGTPSAGPIADNWDNAGWKTWQTEYKTQFPDGFPTPSLFAHGYYVSMSAALTALDKVNGDLSDGQAKLRQTLATMELDTPTGKVRLDENRQAITDIFLTEVAENADGTLFNKVIKVIPKVNQVMNGDRAKFMALGRVGRDVPACS